MKIFKILLLILLVSLNLKALKIEKLRTDLYSKSGINVLKKIELSLEFEGANLQDQEKKLIDSVNTVISSFFYEDLFTEVGKNNFKKTLEKFAYKKYKIKLDDVYILTLNGIDKFDIEEFKRFLENTENTDELNKALKDLQIPKVQSPKIPDLPTLNVPDSDQNDENQDLNSEFLDFPRLDKDLEQKLKNISTSLKDLNETNSSF